MAHIIAAARNKFERHLENLRFRETDWTVEGIIGLRVLATPSTELLDLPAPGVAAELVEAEVGARRGVHKPPPELANNKGVWNPQNDDASCFAWCVRAAVLGIDRAPPHIRQSSVNCGDFFYTKDRPVGKRRHRRLEKVLKNGGLDFSSLPTDRGVTFEDIDEFERRSGATWARCRSSCALGWSRLGAGTGIPAPRKSACRPTVPWAERTVELLLYREAPGREHYMLIYDSCKFDSRRGARLGECRKLSHKSRFRCPRCTRPFASREQLQEHMQTVCSEHPGERFSTIRMPDPKKPSERWLRFHVALARWHRR